MRNRLYSLAVLLGLSAATTTATAASSIAERSTQHEIAALIDGARASNTDALVILQDGKLVAEYYKSGEPPGAIEAMSATKSLIALAFGRLVTQGKIKSIDQPVSDFYPEWKQGRKASITLRMLLNQTSGLQNVPNATVEIYPAPDLVKLALAAELSTPPGQVFSYNNKAMNLLSGIIEQASGLRMDRYIERELFLPMGIEGDAWNPQSGFDASGNPHAMAGWKATSEGMAKIGQLVLDEGRWKGEALIDADYVRAMVGQGPADYRYYGLLWWRRAEMYRFEVEESGLQKFEASGFSAAQAAQLRPFVGRQFETTRQLLELAFTDPKELEDVQNKLNAGGVSLRSMMREIPEPIVAYEANGFLGQYIVVVPRARLVAVRQIEGRIVSGEWPDTYEDFTTRTLALAKTFAPDLSVESAPDVSDVR